MRRLLAVSLMALTLGSCAGTMPAVTGSIINPIGYRELASIEASYGIALAGAVAYRNRPRCTRSQLESFANLCARRSIVIKLQHADQIAQLAIGRAAAFISNNPTLDASSVVQAASMAVGAFISLQAGSS